MMVLAPSVLRVAVDEAEDILQTQDKVIGYETLEDAAKIRKELSRKGVSTTIVVEVGPVQTAKSPWEERVLRSLGLKPGERYTRWGLKRVRSHKRRR